MKISLLLSWLKEPSMAVSLGCLLLCFQDFVIWYIAKVLSLSCFLATSPIGVLFDRAKSIPITHLSLNSNIRFQVYMSDSLFRYVQSR
jgi:hypothetical protein